MFGARTEMQTLSRYVTAAKARRNPPALYRTRVGCMMEARIRAGQRAGTNLHYGLPIQVSQGYACLAEWIAKLLGRGLGGLRCFLARVLEQEGQGFFRADV